ncbi:triggering receptor expressed on myeloid cells 1 [Dromiciops gliroides]|uniref:triggering receptor expressed on myeloid cells 1 n=1 Tax=Dromiciops gliroides TaxID=33562 RepID=UPI001CC552EE|nr:triggering receptor expressed on myeloid cells 1 [Dromiciops gliroides]
MEKTRIWTSQQLLLLLLLINDSGLQYLQCREEGEDATLQCAYNIMKYSLSLKAWQRLGSNDQPETLIQTSNTKGEFSQVRVGKYLLMDDPDNSMMNFTIMRFQKQDSGIYRCIINQPSQEPIVLRDPFQLSTCDANTAITTRIPTAQRLTPRREEPSTILATERKSLPNPSFHTQAPVKSTAHSLTTTLGAKHNDTSFPVHRFSDVLAVTFGILLNKILVFITLYFLIRKKTRC